MQTLPKPLPDELLYSALARATYRYGYWSPKRLLDAVYGRRTVTAVPDLPGNLSALVRLTEEHWRLSLDDLVSQHTLLGYYTHFRGALARRQALDAMAGHGGSLHVRLGVCAGSALKPRTFRLCPQCHAQDIERFGEAYWHRAHHLPGVLVCHLHGRVLHETDVPFRPLGRHAYMAAPMTACFDELRPLTGMLTCPEAALAVAVRSFEILCSQGSADESTTDYRERLEQFGWGSLRVQRVREAFTAQFGVDLLATSFGREDCDPLAWLAEVVRPPRRPWHPFKHVLMDVFFQGRDEASDGSEPCEIASGEGSLGHAKSWGIYKAPELRNAATELAQRGLSTRAVAKALCVDWKTAHRLLAPLPQPAASKQQDSQVDRLAWVQLAVAHPDLGKKALRGIVPALYARIYRNDRDWLLAWCRPEASRISGIRRRIDWSQRDVALEARVRQKVAAVLKEVPARRASKNLILGMLSLRALLAHRAELLPRTSAALESLCETVEDFQLRRMRLALHQERDSAADWLLLRRARINPRRLADGGAGLIQQARDTSRNTGGRDVHSEGEHEQ